MKKVGIVAAHFVPSNLAAVHRARLWSLHLREFGWEPVIVTTDWNYYEETPEPGLLELLPPDLKVIRTRAFGTKPVRLVGDIGLRAFWWHYSALCGLAQRKEMDFLHITIPSFYSACLGRLVHRRFGTPYGIDYIDPWVHQFPGSERRFSKAWGATQIAKILEPWAVRDAALITGINRAYYEGVLQRNPKLARRAVLGAMPYGGSEKDHEHVRTHPRLPALFAAHQGKFNFIYAGAMLPKAYVVLDRLLDALVLVRQKRPCLPGQFHMHFVGTGKSPNDPAGFNILPRIERLGLLDCVSEYPQRLPFLDVLNHLHAASGILVLGSTEPHYSPSKIFQSVMSRRPIFALLHGQSTAVPILNDTKAAQIVTLDEKNLPEARMLAFELEKFVFDNDYSEDQVCWQSLQKHSARESARILASVLDQAILDRN